METETRLVLTYFELDLSNPRGPQRVKAGWWSWAASWCSQGYLSAPSSTVRFFRQAAFDHFLSGQVPCSVFRSSTWRLALSTMPSLCPGPTLFSDALLARPMLAFTIPTLCLLDFCHPFFHSFFFFNLNHHESFF